MSTERTNEQQPESPRSFDEWNADRLQENPPPWGDIEHPWTVPIVFAYLAVFVIVYACALVFGGAK